MFEINLHADFERKCNPKCIFALFFYASNAYVAMLCDISPGEICGAFPLQKCSQIRNRIFCENLRKIQKDFDLFQRICSSEKVVFISNSIKCTDWLMVTANPAAHISILYANTREDC